MTSSASERDSKFIKSFIGSSAGFRIPRRGDVINRMEEVFSNPGAPPRDEKEINEMKMRYSVNNNKNNNNNNINNEQGQGHRGGRSGSRRRGSNGSSSTKQLIRRNSSHSSKSVNFNNNNNVYNNNNNNNDNNDNVYNNNNNNNKKKKIPPPPKMKRYSKAVCPPAGFQPFMNRITDSTNCITYSNVEENMISGHEHDYKKMLVQPVYIPDLTHTGIKTKFCRPEDLFVRPDGSITTELRANVSTVMRKLPKYPVLQDPLNMKNVDTSKSLRKVLQQKNKTATDMGGAGHTNSHSIHMQSAPDGLGPMASEISMDSQMYAMENERRTTTPYVNKLKKKKLTKGRVKRPFSNATLFQSLMDLEFQPDEKEYEWDLEETQTQTQTQTQQQTNTTSFTNMGAAGSGSSIINSTIIET